MEFSTVENLSGLQESIFNLSRGPQLHFGEKSKNYEKMKVPRMGLPMVDNLSGLQESIFSLSRRPQLHFGQKSKN